jgi:hypothetical protein
MMTGLCQKNSPAWECDDVEMHSWNGRALGGAPNKGTKKLQQSTSLHQISTLFTMEAEKRSFDLEL